MRFTYLVSLMSGGSASDFSGTGKKKERFTSAGEMLHHGFILLSNHLSKGDWIHPFSPRPEVQQKQKLKIHLLKTQSSKILPLKPGAGPYIVVHATPTARDFFLATSTLPVHSLAFFSKNISRFYSVLAVAKTGPCLGPKNKIGQSGHRYRQLMQVPALSARGI